MQWAILTATTLLLLGFVLRARLRILQTFFVPASVVGGLMGLLVIQGGLRADVLAGPTGAIAATLRGWPAPLIAVVFAGLLLERPKDGLERSLRGAALNGIMVWIIVLGEIAIGLAAAWLFVRPHYDVPPAFGQLLEAGFAGGHGTATALGGIFGEMLDFEEGLDLGLFMATIGLVISVVAGMVVVNIGVRAGWTRSGRAIAQRITGLEQRHEPIGMAFARVRAEVIDPLAFQLLIVATAFGMGALLQWGFVTAVEISGAGGSAAYLTKVPLFLFTLLGGWMLRGVMTWLGVADLLDGESIRRIVAIAMEFLIVAAIASLRIEVVHAYLGPLLLLSALGLAWAVVCLLVLSRHVLPRDHWFELGLINFGMSTGTTAQGFMLLRIVDKDLESGAAENYALAAPLSAPFVGGGLITMSLPILLESTSTPLVVGVLSVAIVALFFVGRSVRERS